MINKIEELSLNSWPSKNKVFYDGWVLGFSNGFTKRANSISPIYDSNIDINEKIKKCEKLYFGNKQDTIFKVFDNGNPSDLYDVLLEKSYEEDSKTNVMTLKPKKVEYFFDKDFEFEIYETPNDRWVKYYQKLFEMNKDTRAKSKNIINGILLPKYLLLLKKKNKIIGCGISVIEDGYMGISGVAIHRVDRGKGYGKILMNKFLDLAIEKEISKIYLQVKRDNKNALSLYENLGFEEEYTYSYMIKKYK